MATLEERIKVPDLWQQEALRALKSGKDVVVDAPTGAGKTYIFELYVQSRFKGTAIYTVPTRALANDKLLEWRTCGWNVGITTGDVAENLDAPVIVATLETQKRRFLSGDGPEHLVIDEYQMLGDESRGVNYELLIALAPPKTQLLLLSGTVANPCAVVEWLTRLGRNVALARTEVRPVPQEEIYLQGLPDRVPDYVHGYWPRYVARALMADLGPILAFAPRRRACEELAGQLSSALPTIDPLVLTPEQKRLAGRKLARLLKNRIAFHHSGLSYQQRAALIEPLAKSGHLQVVVATTGLGAGINFSMRAILVTDREYRVADRYHLIRPDELAQMFGRAGRRGLDSKGYILVAPGKPRLSEARPLHLKRTNQVEWPAIIAVMRAAIESGQSPVAASDNLCNRLFSKQKVALGLPAETTAYVSTIGSEDCEVNGHPHIRRDRVIEILNFQGEWERRRAPVRSRLNKTLIFDKNRWIPALQSPRTLNSLLVGRLCRLQGFSERVYGREVPLARIPNNDVDGELVLTRWTVRQLRRHEKKPGKRAVINRKNWNLNRVEREIVPLLTKVAEGGMFHRLVNRNGVISAQLHYNEAEVYACLDSKGNALLHPPKRENALELHQSFYDLMGTPENQERNTPAQAWMRLGLIDGDGGPTRRGQIFSFFNHGEGLAVAAALEDLTYPVEDLVYDLANLRAGHRFSERESYSGRLGHVCRMTYKGANYLGYLRKGVPTDYGDGATETLADESKHPAARLRFAQGDFLSGDVERAHLEWRSVLNQIIHAPVLDWERWLDLKQAAHRVLGNVVPSSLLIGLPKLSESQKMRFSCRLRFA